METNEKYVIVKQGLKGVRNHPHRIYKIATTGFVDFKSFSPLFAVEPLEMQNSGYNFSTTTNECMFARVAIFIVSISSRKRF